MSDFLLGEGASLKNDLLSGLTVALALVPEAVAFAFVAGVEPLVGLYAAFLVGFITGVLGGRPGRSVVRPSVSESFLHYL